MYLCINLKLSLNLKYNRLNRGLADWHINRNITLKEKICTRRKTRAFTMERRTVKNIKKCSKINNTHYFESLGRQNSYLNVFLTSLMA
jgi:hypothetical protein